MYRIGEFSLLTGLSDKTLRFYEEIGFPISCYIDEFTGYRYYDEHSFAVVKEIEDYKAMGFKLEEIKYIHDNGINMDMVESKQNDIQLQISMLLDAYGKLDNIRENLRVEQVKRDDIKVKKLVKKN